MKFHGTLSVLSPLAVLASTLLASGCATFGLVYEDVGHPPIDVGIKGDSGGIAWDPNLNASMGGRQLMKKGVACSQDILKLVAWGDGTQAAAAKEGGVTEVVGVDFENTAILAFIYTRNCTVVYGNDNAASVAAPAVAEVPEVLPTAAPAAPAATTEAPSPAAAPATTTAPTAPAP